MTLYIPLIPEVVEKIGRAAYLSKIDLNKEFHQVKMARSDLEKTAIVMQFGNLSSQGYLLDCVTRRPRSKD